MESESRDHQHQAEVCAGTHQSDYTFKEEDVPGLAEALAEVAHKWEEIAVVLRLSEAVRAECREGSSLAMKLYRVLYQWVVGHHSNAARATRDNLKTALASPLVQHPQLASELEDKLKTSLSLHTLTSPQKKSLFQSWIREMLVKKYSQCPEVPQGSWPPVVCQAFINLALIETSGRPSKSDYSIRGDADDVIAMKQTVAYEEVFCAYQRQQKILILGRPGSGKTTLVHKLVRDWSAGKALQGAELVFLVSLRMLSSDNDTMLQNILQSFYFDKNHLMQVSDSIVRGQGEKVCFIFDGFDEYCPSDKTQSVIFALLKKSYLVDAMIIVTSRPAAASAAAQVFDTSYKKIEVFGFSKNQIMEYISLFPFSSSSSANEAHSQNLQSFLSSHPGVLDLCYLPVNCAIICFIYTTEPDHLPDTQTQIYALFTRLIIIRQLTSRDISRQLDSLEDLEGQEAEDFKNLCSLAFDMTTQSQQIITRGPASSDEAHSLGLVTTDITAGLSGYKNSYSFLHLTLQEFLAAYHLSKLSQEEQMSLIEKYGETVHMLTVWKFYFGLVSFETGLERAENLFSGTKRLFSSGKLDCNLFGLLYNMLFKIQCSYEAKQSCIVQLASSQGLTFEHTLSIYDISAIAYTMSMAVTQRKLATPTKSLVFQFWGPGIDKLRMLLSGLNDKALENLVHLEVSFSFGLSITDIQSLAEKLKFDNKKPEDSQGLKCLKRLNFQGNQIGDDGVTALAAGLNGNRVLVLLDLSDNSITPTGISVLLGVDWHIQYLHLSYSNIDDEGAMAVARGLRCNLTLKFINLSHNKINVAGVEALALVLQKHSIRLDLSSNQLTARAASSPDSVPSDCCSNSADRSDVSVHDAEVNLQPHSCNLEMLNLAYNNIKGNLVAVISKFTSLTHLDLTCDQLDLQGAIDVVDYVASSDNWLQLRYLGLVSRTACNLSSLQYDYKNVLPPSGFIVDLLHYKISEAQAINVFQSLKKYDRVGGVCLSDILPHKFTIPDLKKRFQHDRIDRHIIFSFHNNFFLKVPAYKITSELDPTEGSFTACS